MATPTFRAITTAIQAFTSSVSVTAPASTQVGDLLLFTIATTGGAPTTPTGWTYLGTQSAFDGTYYNTQYAFWKIAEAGDAGASFTFTTTGGTTSYAAAISAWQDATGVAAFVKYGSTVSAATIPASPAPTTAPSTCTVVTYSCTTSTTIAASGTERADFASRSDWIPQLQFAVADDTNDPNTTRTATLGSSRNRRTAFTIVLTGNRAPNAPTSLAPGSSTSIDKDITNRFSWSFSDPDTGAGDQQSAYDLRYRIVGTTTWTTVSGGATQYRDMVAGTFTADDWEWQVRTTDNGALTGPWSASAYFTATTAPAGPTITAPTNLGTVDSDPYTVTWTAAEQDAYQIRTVADDGLGAPDTGTIYQDTGTVTSTTARSAPIPFDTNGRDEHVQLRIQVDGLWSDWITVAITVSYTAPATPTVSVIADSPTGAIGIQASHPTPTGSEPDVVTVDWWRRNIDTDGNPVDGEDDPGIRIAIDQAASSTLEDWRIASGQGYEYRAQAWGDNNVSTYSDWEAGNAASATAFPYTLPLTLA